MHRPRTFLNLGNEWDFNIELFVPQLQAKRLQYTMFCVGSGGFSKKPDVVAISFKQRWKSLEIGQRDKELNKQK